MQAARRASLTPTGSSTPTEGSDPTPGPEPDADVRRPRLWPLFAAVAVLGLALDVVTKIEAVARLEPGVPVSVVGRVLTFQLIRNPGAAFSQGTGFTWVFAIAAVLVLAFVLVRLVPRLGHAGWAVALGLLVAGVSGNLADRIFREPGPFRGHVVDFLQLPHWPIFNVADMCITASAILIVILSLLKNVGVDGRRPGAEAQQEPQPGTQPDPDVAPAPEAPANG